jgi:hypothetical protein
VYNIDTFQPKEHLKMLYRDEPSLKDLYTISSEEYYEENYDFGGSYDPMPLDLEEECPQWVQEQIDEEIPF